MTSPEFTIGATFGDAIFRVAAVSDMIDSVVAFWTMKLAGLGVADIELRSTSRQLIVESLMQETYAKPDESHWIASALVWLTVNGPNAEKLVPDMRKGGIDIHYEITRLGPTSFNFHMECQLDDQRGTRESPPD
jgi:hypothetical protein